MRKWIRLIVGLLACLMLGYSVYQMTRFGTEAVESRRLNAGLAAQAVKPRETADPEQTAAAGETAAVEPAKPRPQAPIEVDFDLLREQSGDVIGWLYCEDTPINYPLAQGADNSYYLRRLLDGTPNNSGTLFADYRCARDFSDFHTVIYGHNMKNATMFGSLKKYENQAYYDAHPILWLLTPQGDFQVELLAGYVTASTSDAYALPDNSHDALALARAAMEKSTFESGLTPQRGERYLTLSTCSYEFDEARYVLLGRLI